MLNDVAFVGGCTTSLFITPHLRNPLKSTTYGVGQMIKAALDTGISHLIIGIGGSATNDGGAGMLQALGVKLLDHGGCEIGYRQAPIDDSGDYNMNKAKIAIACQGGGSQTAFTAGVLKALFADNVHQDKEIIALTGTSGGAVNAALAWYGLLKTAKGDTTPIGQRITDFWEDLMAKEPLELFLDQTMTDTLRKVSVGLLPMYEVSPSSPLNQWLQSTLSKFLPRERFTDFKGLLEDHIQFDEIDNLIEMDSPILHIGAANVLKGNLKIFSSRFGEFRVEAILASACIPSIFPAVQIGEDYYWDGMFSGNPPVNELIQARFMGLGNFPDEIWIVLINPMTCKNVPTRSNEIVDRRNQMIGNVSLLQDIETIELLARAVKGKAFKEEFLESYGVTSPDFVKIRFIQMSENVQDSLDYPSKLSRNPELIHKLMEDGEKQGRAFLEGLDQPAHTIEEAASKLRGEFLFRV